MSNVQHKHLSTQDHFQKTKQQKKKQQNKQHTQNALTTKQPSTNIT